MTLPASFAAALAARYRLERPLGAGGMATVYLAYDLRHRRLVAIKVLDDRLTELLGEERFTREIDIAAGLAHPHILPLYDSGEADGRRYYVMPFVDGESLRQRLDRDGPLAIPDAVRLLHDIAEALDHADRRGVVHRDIKPANVLLAEGHATVADFGVAKALDDPDDPRSDTTGASVIGTPAYMSPEQTVGGAAVDHRSDLYAFGVVAYELLTGRPPFTGSPTEVIHQHLIVPPVPVTAHRHDLPTALAMLVMRCLEKRPEDRPQHAAEVLGTLESLLAPTATSAPLGRVPQRRSSDADRRRATRRRAAGLVVLAVVASGAVLWRDATRPPDLPLITRQTALTADAALKLEPVLSPDGRSVAYTDGPMSAPRVMIMQVATRTIVPLTDSASAPQRFPQWSEDGTHVAFLSDGTIWTAPAMGGGHATPLLRPGDGPPIEDFALSHAGDRAVVVRSARMSIVRVDGSAPPIALDLVNASRPAWSPDDRWIAVADRTAEYARGIQQFANFGLSSLWLFSSDGAVRRPLTDSLTAAPQAGPVWSGDGRRLFFVSLASGTREIYTLALDGAGHPRGTPARLTTGAGPHGLTVSRDGARIVYSAYRVRSAVWRVPIPAHGEARLDAAERLTHDLAEVHTMTASRDGRWLYYDAAREGAADLYRVVNGDWPPERLTDHPAGDFTPEPSPDGTELVFQSHRHGNRDLFLMDAAGGVARPLLVTPEDENYPRWSPDGSTIAFWRTPGVWIIRRDGRGGWTSPEKLSDSLGPPTWTPDGTGIITYRAATLIIRIDLATRRFDTLYVGGTADRPKVNRPFMSRDGRSIIFKDLEPIASFWAIPAAGGTPRRLLRADARRPSHRLEYWTDGTYLYFTIDERQSDLWSLELARDPR